jgi:two-component system phosphate regulon response regulator PhoB
MTESRDSDGQIDDANRTTAAPRLGPDVLVVEDDPEINELIGAYVELAGYSCRRVLRGEDALCEARAHHPMLVVLDVMLPDIDGFEVCRRLRSASDTAHIPIVMLTALDQPDMRARAQQCGAAEYLTKPFDPDRLLEAIRARADQRGEPAHAG